MKVELRAAAEADLEAIVAYTKQQWGQRQARDYLTNLRRTITGLAQFPSRNSIYTSGHGEFRKAPCGEHFVFYLVADGLVDVVRILHKTMDFDERLS